MDGFFYGWYLKCQSDIQTLGVIPAVHKTGRKRTCSIQVITGDGAWTAEFSGDSYERQGRGMSIGRNRFGEKGICLEVCTSEMEIRGKLDFGPLSPLKYDIMGPFALVPFMECRHSVWSMRHLVSGAVHVNGQIYLFQNDLGYWEGDRGRSFPQKYLWTQCLFSEGSLMLSIADIPVMGSRFTGIIGAVLWRGKVYRLATYLGARVMRIQNKSVCVRQGELELEACLLEAAEHPLHAPVQGNMVRLIRESAACRAFYRFQQAGQKIFEFETEMASFEYEYPF